jgi:serine/threonine protein kinase
MRLRAGDKIGPHEIVGLLGDGAMGEVYRARDTRLGRDVAVKVLRPAFINDAARLARLEREGRLLSQVSHPNICTLFDILEFDNAPVLVLELVEGETLQQRLLRGPMPLREALRCASAIAAALEAAHRKGIIHRDLKPSNIKLVEPGSLKVLDFGVATLAHGVDAELGAADLTQTLGGTKEGALVGTVAYVSPEQAMGDRVDARTDIWAFGCLLYEMLTARRAFPGVAVADTLGAVMRGEPDWTALPAETPPPCELCCADVSRRIVRAGLRTLAMRGLKSTIYWRDGWSTPTRHIRRRDLTAVFRRRDGAGWLLRRRLQRVPSSQASWRDCSTVRQHRCYPRPTIIRLSPRDLPNR